ncbi:NADH-quinone oxidoreductase subunit A [Pontibacter chinhatensis]|uniref:NADH-quinone oxidoreductase subunit n=1 Tax=Pontibacter chinhatensis TaxID=1436961 RepID=A0A1I2S7Y6_9BACT|nr:NADH-quinone oxidoreductase subunit A [Pontibacter chinhatensis]SFG48952.1 NADH dehydrogenase subunit A [Pontibacter chinhatensis]
MEPSVNQYLPSDFLPILIQFAAALGFVVFALVLTHILGPKRTSEVKGAAFESGIESVGDARTPISYKYFITAILFVLFDVEIIFMYPWAVNFREYGMAFFTPMLIFLTVLLAGFFYEIKKGILK